MTEVHNQDNPEERDLLWVSTEEDDVSEGEVIMLSPLAGGQWYASHDYADEYGGWPTVWYFSGGEDRVVRAVLSYLETEMNSIQARK